MGDEATGHRRHRVALVCDFFYPRLGGVEMHIWSLSQVLIRQGHKVIVITHAYDSKAGKLETGEGSHGVRRRRSRRTGVRYLSGPLKVYYCPFVPFTDEDCLPTLTASFPLIRWILIREAIDIVHAHQATSVLANEAVTYAAELGLRSVYTDHSLFGFDDIASLLLNRVLKTTLSTVGAAICVSNTCRDNLLLRAHLDPSTVHLIPNAIDTSRFTPDPSQRPKERINVVFVSRLVYRKGVDLLVGIIPPICAAFPNVDFILAGDGSKRFALEEMVEREQLQDRVEFLGAVGHSQVRDVLVRGSIFLNCSLTESFCIAILEAASCGLYVVSNNVGGVPEVLPNDMISLSEPSVPELVRHLADAIETRLGLVDPLLYHSRVKTMYSWERVARSTVAVYDKVLAQETPQFLERLARYRTVGSCAGLVACVIAITFHFFVLVVEWWQPREFIDVVPDLEW